MKFEEHNFEGIGSLVSLPSSQRKGQRVFFATNVARLFGFKNTTQVLKDAGCIKFDGSNQQECDYTTLKKKDAKDFFEMLISIGKNRVYPFNGETPILTEKSPSITLLTESGVWKLALNSKLEIGIKLRNWLAKEVLPSITATGMYLMPPATTNTNELQIKELSRLSIQAEQIQESKDVNKFKYEQRNCRFDIINHNKANHKQVHNRSVKELKILHPDMKNKSGKDILRAKEPILAVVMATNDWLVSQGAELENLREIDKALPQLLTAMQNFGMDIHKFVPETPATKD